MKRSDSSIIIGILTGSFLLAGFVNPSITLSASSTPQVMTSIPTDTPTSPTPEVISGLTKTMETDGMVMVYVPAGDFTMGFDRAAKKDMSPGHTVNLDSFWIDRTEVTNAQYAKCVTAGNCDEPRDLTSHNRVNYYNGDRYAAFPVINITYNEAKAYCQWAGRALPTEAQWEKAARGTDGRIYPWGDKAASAGLANFGKPMGDTVQVGSYPDGASQYGALDMAGNIREWTADWYDETYYRTSPKENPTGPSTGYKRSVRGGSWGDDLSNIRVFIRWGVIPVNGSNDLGFRCAMPG